MEERGSERGEACCGRGDVGGVDGVAFFGEKGCGRLEAESEPFVVGGSSVGWTGSLQDAHPVLVGGAGA